MGYQEVERAVEVILTFTLPAPSPSLHPHPAPSPRAGWDTRRWIPHGAKSHLHPPWTLTLSLHRHQEVTNTPSLSSGHPVRRFQDWATLNWPSKFRELHQMCRLLRILGSSSFFRKFKSMNRKHFSPMNYGSMFLHTAKIFSFIFSVSKLFVGGLLGEVSSICAITPAVVHITLPWGQGTVAVKTSLFHK